MTRKLWRRVAFAVTLGLGGLVGLPLVFGSLPDPTLAVLWLGLALVDGVVVIPLALLVARPLAEVLQRLPTRGLPAAAVVGATLAVARLTLTTVGLLVAQAVVRRPLVAVFGAAVEPFFIEASVAISVMLLLTVLLVWMYREASPLVEGVAQAALDAVLATSVSENMPAIGSVKLPARPTPATDAAPTWVSSQAAAEGPSQHE